jgi:hypothetical protein
VHEFDWKNYNNSTLVFCAKTAVPYGLYGLYGILKNVPRNWQQPYGRRTTVRMSKCALLASVSVLLCMLKLNSMLCCSKSVPYGFLLLLVASVSVLLLCLGNRAPFSAANPPSEMGNPSPILALSQSLKFSWKE